MIIGLAGSPWALEAMKTPEDVMGHAVVYIRIYFLGIIVNLVYNMGAGILRAVGDSRRPLYFLIASCFTNIVLDIVFVVYLHMASWEPRWLPSSPSWSSAVLVHIRADEDKGVVPSDPPVYSAGSGHAEADYPDRIPRGLQSVMYSASNVIIQSSVNALGTDTIAAWTAYGKIDSVFWMIINAFGISVTTFVGQNYGAGKRTGFTRGFACVWP